MSQPDPGELLRETLYKFRWKLRPYLESKAKRLRRTQADDERLAIFAEGVSNIERAMSTLRLAPWSAPYMGTSNELQVSALDYVVLGLKANVPSVSARIKIVELVKQAARKNCNPEAYEPYINYVTDIANRLPEMQWLRDHAPRHAYQVMSVLYDGQVLDIELVFRESKYATMFKLSKG